MYVLDQFGKSLYNISTASCIRLEYTKDNPKRYGKYAKFIAVIMLYYVNEGGCILAGYEDADEAEDAYTSFALAIANKDINVFDLNGALSTPPIEDEGPEIGAR